MELEESLKNMTFRSHPDALAVLECLHVCQGCEPTWATVV